MVQSLILLCLVLSEKNCFQTQKCNPHPLDLLSHLHLYKERIVFEKWHVCVGADTEFVFFIPTKSLSERKCNKVWMNKSPH